MMGLIWCFRPWDALSCVWDVQDILFPYFSNLQVHLDMLQQLYQNPHFVKVSEPRLKKLLWTMVTEGLPKLYRTIQPQEVCDVAYPSAYFSNKRNMNFFWRFTIGLAQVSFPHPPSTMLILDHLGYAVESSLFDKEAGKWANGYKSSSFVLLRLQVC